MSGTKNKGAAHVITVEHRASRRECHNQQLMITLEIYPTLPQRQCDFSKRTSHSHEFEIILKVKELKRILFSFFIHEVESKPSF